MTEIPPAAGSASPLPPPNQVVFSTFRDMPASEHGAGWDRLWTTAVTPWDRGGPSDALRDLLSERADLVRPPRLPTASTLEEEEEEEEEAAAAAAAAAMVVGAEREGSRRTRKKALVPGCGRGHDVLLLTSFGYDVVGLDLSPVAIAEAKENDEKVRRAGKAGSGSETAGRTTWVVGDFFDDGFLRDAGVEKFDLIFDYTFSCALPMSMRPQWAARMASLLEPASGRLVILQFPNGKSLKLPGPPWGVNTEMYTALLARPGDDITHDEDGRVRGADTIERAGGGLRRLASFTPKRTHKAGMADDGTVTDVVSVWSH